MFLNAFLINAGAGGLLNMLTAGTTMNGTIMAILEAIGELFGPNT
jgi:hypothetical protein